MATLLSLTLDVLDQIYGQMKLTRPASDQLARAVSSNTDTSFEFDGAGSSLWERGDYAEYDDGAGTAGEIIRFYADHDTVDSDVKVTRGERRSTAAASFAVGDIFLKNPAHTKVEIQKAINETIDSDMQNGVWYRTARTIAYSTGRNRYPAAAADYKIDKMYQYDTSSSSVGDTTFIYTGSASEDEWTTSSAHGLAVGDAVSFSAVGLGATEYALGVIYYVAAIPTTLTFQLSATESTTVLEGSADSTGTWTLQTVVFDYREFPGPYYEIVTDVASGVDSTGRSVLLRGLFSPSDTIHYVARTRPSSSDIASLPTELANAVPYGAVARLAGGTATRSRPASESTISYADAAWFRQEFDRMLDQTRTRLLKELQPQANFVNGPTSSSGYSWGRHSG